MPAISEESTLSCRPWLHNLSFYFLRTYPAASRTVSPRPMSCLTNKHFLFFFSIVCFLPSSVSSFVPVRLSDKRERKEMSFRQLADKERCLECETCAAFCTLHLKLRCLRMHHHMHHGEDLVIRGCGEQRVHGLRHSLGTYIGRL